MTLYFSRRRQTEEENPLYEIVPQIVTSTGRKKAIRVVIDTLYFDSAIVLADSTYYPTTPCIPELIDVVNAAVNEEVLGQLSDNYSVACVLLHANMGGAHSLFDWNNDKKNYIISMKEVHGRLINLQLAGIVYDSSRNKILIMLSIMRDGSDRYAYYLKCRKSTV